MNSRKSGNNSRNISLPSNSSFSNKINTGFYVDDIPCSKQLFTRTHKTSSMDPNGKSSIDESFEWRSSSDNGINTNLPGTTSSTSASIKSVGKSKESIISSSVQLVARFPKSSSKEHSSRNSTRRSMKSDKCSLNSSNSSLRSSSFSKSKTSTNNSDHVTQSANQMDDKSLKSSTSESDGINVSEKSLKSSGSSSMKSNASPQSVSCSSNRTRDSMNQGSNVASKNSYSTNDNGIESNNQMNSQSQQSLSSEKDDRDSTVNSLKSRENSFMSRSSSHHSTSSSGSGTKNSTNGDVVPIPNCIVSQSLISASNDDNSLQFPLELGKRMSMDGSSSFHNLSSSSGKSSTSMHSYINHCIAPSDDQIHTKSLETSSCKDNVIVVTDQTLEFWENDENNIITILPCTSASSSTSNEINNEMEGKDIHMSNEIGSQSLRSSSSDILQYHSVPESSNDLPIRPASMNELMKFESAEDFISQTESFSSIQNVSGINC